MIPLIILYLAVSTLALGDYTDFFARTYMFPLSAAAYSDKPNICLRRMFRNASLYRQTTVVCGMQKTTCSGFTAVIPSDKAIVLSFRGTTSTAQLLEESAKSAFNGWFKWMFGGHVSSYFGNAFTKVWNGGMGADFVKLRKQYPNFEIWVTGHSLGGSLASLANSYILGKGYADPLKTKLMTFGQPRTGDPNFSNTHKEQAEYAFRVTHWRDIVPHILSVGYRHHRRETFYQSGMKPKEFKVCEDGESNECSNGLYFKSSTNDHTHYFGKMVSEYGIKGCV
ncbi:hypothetical protein RB195_000132 [Necator americanus]|uniref:Fungal lipase-type domain-containing protein n=1 Tax=Necator americanus TaxID=51031 RepID=A0ABR1D8Z4_NECAM